LSLSPGTLLEQSDCILSRLNRYMSGECAECGHTTQWEDALGSAICTSCGTLADASQNVLASHLDLNNSNGGFEFYNWTGGNTTLKSIRNKNGWALAGQGKEARDRQNSVRNCLIHAQRCHNNISPVCNAHVYPDIVSTSR
jgi:hypothetical protein